MIELVKQELSIPKELHDIKVAIVELIKDIKDKKEMGLIVGENLPLIMSAIQGYEKLGEELKSEFAPNAAAVLAAEIAAVLLAKKEEQPLAQP